MKKADRGTGQQDVRTDGRKQCPGAGEANGREEELLPACERCFQPGAQGCHTSQLGHPLAGLHFLGRYSQLMCRADCF